MIEIILIITLVEIVCVALAVLIQKNYPKLFEKDDDNFLPPPMF